MMASIFPITLILFLLTTALAIPTISINGAKFFLSNGKQFFIKGAPPRRISLLTLSPPDNLSSYNPL
jgi:hypothetical protein